MRSGADWYQREPMAYLGGVQGMTVRQHAVYSVIIDLLYLHGGEIINDPKFIAGYFSDLGSSSVRTAINQLVSMEKLIENRGKITQKRAKTEAKTRQNLRENRQKAGKKGGKNSAESKKNNDLTEASASSKTQPDKSRVDKIREEGKEIDSARARATRLPEDWVPSERGLQWARQERLSEREIERETEKFRDHFRAASGANARKIDWTAAWRNWLRRHADTRQAGRQRSPAAGKMDDFRELIAEAKEHDRRRRESVSDHGEEPSGRLRRLAGS